MYKEVNDIESNFKAKGLEFVVTDAMRTQSEAVTRSVDNMTTAAVSKEAAQKTYASKYDSAIAEWHDATTDEAKVKAREKLIAIRGGVQDGGHSAGKAIDIRSRSTDSPAVIESKLKTLRDMGYNAVLENKGGSNQHIHINLN